MRLTLIAMLCFSLPAMAGVKDGSTHRTIGGGEVTVSSRGTLHGDTKIVFTDATGSTGEITGTPTTGGCAGETDDCGSGTTAGSDGGTGGTFTIDGGDVKQKNSTGDWIELNELDDGGCGAPGETIGGLPDNQKGVAMLFLPQRRRVSLLVA